MNLTVEQQAIVDLPATTKALVTAGPGTGKTHTLIARISKLVDQDELAPSEILTLSFSRAAVGEVKRRLRAVGDYAGQVTPITFDSMATQVLSQTDPEGSWTEKSYDGRIEAAAVAVEAFAEYFDEVRHICIDEVQDLVGVRMLFVRALLEWLDVGFTLLGDPAQGIYDFSLPTGADLEEAGSPAFYGWLRTSIPSLEDLSLTHNHRAKSDHAKTAAAFGALVISDPAGAGREMQALLDSLPPVSNLGVLRLVPKDERTAVLCRNNGDALWISRELDRLEIDHILQRGATASTTAPWVARLAQLGNGDTVSRDRLARLLCEIGPGAPDIDDVWGPIRRLARTDGGQVDLDRFVRQLRIRRVPDEFHAHRSAPIVVSTVHRAKGLEFERVLVVGDGWRSERFDDDDAKTLFVAMSRSIEGLADLRLDRGRSVLRLCNWKERWTDGDYRSWVRLGMEIQSGDVDVLDPPGVRDIPAKPADLQQLLAREVAIDDEVFLQLVRPTIGAPGAVYNMVWKGRPIATMSEEFGEAVVRVVKASSSWKHPKRIHDLRIDAIRSVGGDPNTTNKHGLGLGGAWLVPSVTGLGRFDWEWKATTA